MILLINKIMKKIFNTILKLIFSLIILMPALGVIGIFPAPTSDLYNTPQAFAFIEILNASGYIMYMMAIVSLATLFCLWTKRVALGAILILPVTLNIVGFHAFLDGGLFTGGAVMGNLLLLINLYFLYKHRNEYSSLLSTN